MVGSIWKHIPGLKQRQRCAICNAEDSMEHILIECTAQTRRRVWDLARKTWPHAPELWPIPSLGIILGTGCLSLPKEHAGQVHNRQNTHPSPKRRATLRLLQIILSEAAHLIWVLRCEQVIHKKVTDERDRQKMEQGNKRKTHHRQNHHTQNKAR
jgi:hypothetical protein